MFKSKRLLTITGLILVPFWTYIMFESTGLGHGNYILFNLFNAPFSLLLSLILNTSDPGFFANMIFFSCLLITPVLYGYIIDLFSDFKKEWVGFLIVFILHYACYIRIRLSPSFYFYYQDNPYDKIDYTFLSQGYVFFAVWNLWILFVTLKRWRNAKSIVPNPETK